MLLNEEDEKNIIKSFAKDLEHPEYPKDKLRTEILDMLKRGISEYNVRVLESMLQQVNQIAATNQNEMLRIVAKDCTHC